MKLYFKAALSSILVLSVFLTGCLKDKGYDDRSIQSVRSDGAQKVIGVSLTVSSTTNFLQMSLNSSNTDTTFNLVPISIATQVAEEDITVDVVQNSALIGSYNAANGTVKEQAPASVYTIINPAVSGGTGYVVTIPKGSNTGYLKIKIKPSNFLGHDYALGFQISKIETPGYLIASNLSTGIVGIGIKNKWDGAYTLDGTLVDVLAPGNSSVPGDPYPYDVYLVTTGATTNTMFIPGSGFFHLIAGNSVYGEFDPVFNFIERTTQTPAKKDTMTAVNNYYGDPSPTRGRTGEIDPSGANVVNADKSIDMKYFLKQNGALKGKFDEHLTYVGPRP